MQIFAVANDPKSLEEIKTAIQKAAPDAALTGFALAGDALSAVRVFFILKKAPRVAAQGG